MHRMIHSLVALGLTLVSLSTASPSRAQDPSDQAYVPLNRRPQMTRWHGGTHSLPFGPGVSPSVVVSAARAMDLVTIATQQFSARGYVRRAELDYGATTSGYSCAVLGFEKPGVPINQSQPEIVVISKPLAATNTVDGSATTVIATQVFGGMVADSAGIPVARETPTDPSFVLVATGNSGNAVVRPLVDSDDLEFRYSGYSLASNGAPDPFTATWDAMPEVWRNYGINLVVGAAAGAIGGGYPGALTGAIAAAILYWFPRP